MKNRSVFRIPGIFMIGNILLFLFLSARADDLKIGAAAVKITPPLGVPLAGQYFDRGATAVHDDLFSKALVIEKGGEKVAIVSCDLVDIGTDLVPAVRRLAERSTGIPEDHIMVNATHSHTGPVIPSPGNINSSQGPIPEILKSYISKLPGLICESIKQANANLKPALISCGMGHEETISFNRRFFMTDGTVGWNPGKLNPKIIKPAGPIDPDVAVLFAETPEGKPISTLVNFALHLDIAGGLEISADMPYTLSKILGEVKSPDMITLFAQGCCGNINHINVKTAGKQSGHAEAERIGTVLAGEVIRTFSGMKPLSVENISVRSEIVPLPLAEISAEELPWAREIASRYGKPDAAPFMDMVKAFKIIEINDRKGKPLEAEIQAIALGDSCAVVSLPGEIFTELGMYIKSRSPYPFTIIEELANVSVDYIPDMKAYMEGNYEPVSSRCAPGSGELLAKKAIEMLWDLKRN
jgi:neutral ceramidase